MAASKKKPANKNKYKDILFEVKDQVAWVTINRPAAPGLSSLLAGPGWFSVLVSGDAGPDYSIQGSTNLVNWTVIQTTNPPGLPFLFTDPGASNYHQRFYRVLLGP